MDEQYYLTDDELEALFHPTAYTTPSSHHDAVLAQHERQIAELYNRIARLETTIHSMARRNTRHQ